MLGFTEFAKFMPQIQEMQAKIREAMAKLEGKLVEGESRAGAVKVVMTARNRLVSISIDDSLMQQEEKEMMQDLIVAAVNNALEKAEALVKHEMESATGFFGGDMLSMLGKS